MGCCCSKSVEVKDSIVPGNQNNVLDSPFTKPFQRERDGTLKEGQVPKEILNAYEEVLSNESFFEINESFKVNPLQLNPFIEPWIETLVPESAYLQKPVEYTPPSLSEPQPVCLLDMSNSSLSVLNVTTGENPVFKGKLYSASSRCICLSVNKVLICGGRNNRNTFLLDVDSGAITKQGCLKEVREYHSLAIVDDIVVATGGMGFEELRTCEVFYRGQWSLTGEMVSCRSMHASVCIDKCVYVVGGIRSGRIEKWNGGVWSEVMVSLQRSLGRVGICAISQHEFIVVGGESNGEYSTETWLVNFFTLTLTPLPSIPTVAIFDSTGSYQSGFATFYLAGQVFIYNVNSNTWVT